MMVIEKNTITLDNVVSKLVASNPIKKSRVYGANTISRYRLLETLRIKLSDNTLIVVPVNFEWDLSSVPKIFHSILSVDSDAEIAYLIHDYLYVTKKTTRKFADDEMFIWAKKVNGTSKWYSAKNIDNRLRYIAVSIFGGLVYNKKH